MFYGAIGIAAYLVGSFPTGVVLSRRRYGIDVREMGSGNIGATNITRTFGWAAGVFTFLVDYLKGVVPIVLIARYFPELPWLVTVAGAALVLGHCYSIFLRLRGGKGVATSFGVLSAVAPWGAVIAAAVYAVVLGTVRVSAVGSLSGMVAAVAYAAIAKPPVHIEYLIYAFSLIVLVRHQSNIRRLVAGARRPSGVPERPKS